MVFAFASSCHQKRKQCKRRRLGILALFSVLLWLLLVEIRNHGHAGTPHPTASLALGTTSNRGDPILPSTYQYWADVLHRWKTWLGLDEALPEPVAELLKSASLSNAEIAQLKRQQEDFYHDDSVRSLRVTLCVSLPAFVFALLAFELLLHDRPTWLGRSFAVPRLIASLGGSIEGTSAMQKKASRAVGLENRCRSLELLRVVLALDETEVLESAGMDGLMLLRFCALCGKFCALSSIWCLVLLPLYSTGGNWWIVGPKQGLSRYSMSNLKHGSPLLWAVVPVMYLCTFTLCGLLWKEYERFVELRCSFLSGDGHSSLGQPSPDLQQDTGNAAVDHDIDARIPVQQSRRTVMVEQLPLELRESVALRSFFEDLLGVGSVHSVALVPADARKLSEMLETRERLLRDHSDSRALLELELKLRLRREDFGRAMAAPRMFSGLQTAPAGIPPLVLDAGDTMEGIAARVKASIHVQNGCSRTPPKTLQLQEARSAGQLVLQTTKAAIHGAATTVYGVATEVAGSSVRRVGQLVPTSAFASTAASSVVGTPYGCRTPSKQTFSTSVGNTRGKLASTAFVTFTSLYAASIACQVAMAEDVVSGCKLTVDAAPAPRDVLWRNVAREQTQRLVRRFFVERSLLFGLLFWSVPVSLLQAWCSLSRLQQLLPGGMQLPQQFIRSDLYALLTLYLPVLALLILLEVLPLALYRLASRYEGLKAWSGVQILTMQRYWCFQLATICVTVLSGSISDSLKAILDHPASVLWQLGQSLPNVAVYFLVTVLSSALVVGPLSLLRLPVVARIFCSGLARRLSGVMSSSGSVGSAGTIAGLSDAPNFIADLSALLLVLLICTTYIAIAPLLMLAGAFFFVTRRQVLAVRYLYIHLPRFDSGGEFWYILCDQTLLALLLGNLTTLAVIGLRSGYGQLTFLSPLPFLVLGFRARMEYRFAEPSRRLSLRIARAIDASNPHLSDSFSLDAYWHPALRLVEHGDFDVTGPLEAVVETSQLSEGVLSWRSDVR